jgi:hypothetical protein
MVLRPASGKRDAYVSKKIGSRCIFPVDLFIEAALLNIQDGGYHLDI